MGKQVKPANAAAVTRVLTRNGIGKSELHHAARGMVRGGWSEYTRGVRSEQCMNRERDWDYRKVAGTWQRVRVPVNKPNGVVEVHYEQGSGTRYASSEKRRSIACGVLAEAEQHLQAAGYQVDRVNFEHETYSPSLFVWRADENGERIRP